MFSIDYNKQTVLFGPAKPQRGGRGQTREADCSRVFIFVGVCTERLARCIVRMQKCSSIRNRCSGEIFDLCLNSKAKCFLSKNSFEK